MFDLPFPALSGKILRSFLCLALAASPLTLNAQTSTQYAYVANENGQTISGYRLNASSGQLTPLEGSPFITNGAGIGSIAVDPAGRFLYITDQYGGTKNVSGFRINRETGGLTALPGSPFNAGMVPSDIVIDPSGRFAYVADFQGGTVSALKIDQRSGCLIPIAAYPAGNTPVALTVDPLGKFVYVASDGIAGFTINPATGALTKISGSPFLAGSGPRSIAVDPNDRFVYVGNYQSDNISGFTINASTGALSPLGTSPYAAGSGPVTSVKVDPTGGFLYAAGDGGVFAYSIDQNSEDFGSGYPPENLYGNLTPLKGSPFGGGTPAYVDVDYTGTFVYGVNPLTDEVSVFTFSNGGLQTNSSVPTGSDPVGIALVRPQTFPLFKATLVAEPSGYGSVNSIQAVGVNDLGQVAGSVSFYSTSEHFAEAFLFADGVSNGVASSRVSTASGLNAKGQVVGQQDIAPPSPLQPPPQAFLYSLSSNSTIDIDNIPDRQSNALSINDAGQITGSAYRGTCPPPFAVYPACLGNFNAFIYTGSGLTNLGTLGGNNSAGTSINNLGEIAGTSQVANGDEHLFLYKGGHMHDLGMPAGQTVLNAKLNDHGDILVTTVSMSGTGGSYLYNGHTFRKLPFVGAGINDATEIVGSAIAPTAGSRAYVYFGGNSVDLNELVDPSLPLLTLASGVSNNGNIVAYGLNGRLYVLSLP